MYLHVGEQCQRIKREKTEQAAPRLFLAAKKAYNYEFWYFN